jgi:hypothetical protein
MHEIRQILKPISIPVIDLSSLHEYPFLTLKGESFEETARVKDHRSVQISRFRKETMAKYLQCSECGKLAFYYDDFVGTEKPFYRRFMRYPEGETKHEPPRCFSCGAVPRLIHENIKEEKAAAAKH